VRKSASAKGCPGGEGSATTLYEVLPALRQPAAALTRVLSQVSKSHVDCSKKKVSHRPAEGMAARSAARSGRQATRWLPTPLGAGRHSPLAKIVERAQDAHEPGAHDCRRNPPAPDARQDTSKGGRPGGVWQKPLKL
jgi:hypothetical protein